MRDFWRAVKLASSQKKLTAIAMGISFVATMISLIGPLLFKSLFDLIDTAIRKGEVNYIPPQFWILISAFAVVTIIQSQLELINHYYIVKWWIETKKLLQIKVFAHLESLSVSYFEKNSTGKIKERVDRGISDLNNIMEGALMDIFPQFIFVVVATFLLFQINVVFGFILMFSIPIFTLISLKFAPELIKVQDKTRDAYEATSGTITESIINMKTIKSYATEDRHKNKLARLITKAINSDMLYITKRIFMNIFRYTIINSAQILILGLGVYWTLMGKITLGGFILAWQYTNRSIQPMWYLMRVVDNITRDMRSVRRVFELLDTKAEIVDVPSAKNLKLAAGKVTFDKVSFGYEDKKIVDNFTLEIPAGKVVAFVGKSGVGKSTLIKLLMRFYDPQKGRIIIDGQDIKKVTQKSLRENIAVVMQDSILFNDTAFNNIKYGAPRATKSKIETAAKVAHAHDFIVKLPKKYQTVVGERGVKLSGGEQQRISIARAILKNPPILILDEATSALDSENERLIQDALWKLIKGRTTFIIAHRLSTIMRADLIVVMDKGKITEMGTHDELVAKKNGIYSGLYDIQSGGYLGE